MSSGPKCLNVFYYLPRFICRVLDWKWNIWLMSCLYGMPILQPAAYSLCHNAGPQTMILFQVWLVCQVL